MRVEIQSKNGLKTVNLNRRRAIREKCLNCSAWSTREVTDCKFTDCSLHPFREGKGKQNSKDRERAIKAFCLWCQAGQRREIAKCVSVHCALFGFRSGRAEKPLSTVQKAHGEASFEANPPG